MIKKIRRIKKQDAGFTLIEILVVIVIIGVLAMYIAPKIMGRTEDAKINHTRLQVRSLETALKLYKFDNGVYPTTEQGLRALIEKPETGTIPKSWRKGGYMEKGKIPKDGWRNDFIYLSPGAHGDFDIISYGADGIPGGEDEKTDINNWEIE